MELEHRSVLLSRPRCSRMMPDLELTATERTIVHVPSGCVSIFQQNRTAINVFFCHAAVRITAYIQG